MWYVAVVAGTVVTVVVADVVAVNAAAAVKSVVVVLTAAAAVKSAVVVVTAAAVREYQATRIRPTPVDRRDVDWPAVCDGCHGKVAMATVEVEQAQAMAEVQQGVDLA